MEYWGTLATHDHRTKILKTSLVLFDRLVVPLPDKPVYDISQEELDELGASLAFLKEHGAAVPFSWKPGEFNEWQARTIQESLCVGRRDNLYDSRMMLSESIEDLAESEKTEAVGVPVYGSRVSYEEATADVNRIQDSLLVGVTTQLPSPDLDCPLETLVELRNKEAFQVALKSFRDWQTDILPQLILEDSMATVNTALDDFKKMTAEYERIMTEHLKKRRRTFVVSLLALSGAVVAALKEPEALPFLIAAGPALLSFNDLKEPAWRVPQDTKYAPAGVIFEARQHLGAPTKHKR